MKRVIIDTDAGVDDTLALILALRSPELQVEAVTTVSGNVEVDRCTENVLLIMEELGAEPKPIVASGEKKPLVRKLLTAPEVHGKDGIGNITTIIDESGTRRYPDPRPLFSTEPAPELIARLAKELGPKLEIITLGPLTNIAKAVESDPDAMNRVGKLTMMGGVFREYGNTSLVGEFNFYVDPEAVKIALGLDVPKLIVPLDVTEKVVLPRRMLDEWSEIHGTKALELADNASDFYMGYHEKTLGIDGCFMHDPLTVAAAIDESLIETRKTFVQIETKGEYTSGMTLADLRPDHQPKNPNAEVAIKADDSRFLDFFLERLAQ